MTMDIKQVYGKMLMAYAKLFGVDAAKKFDTSFRFHRKLNLKQPVSLADKVSYIELHAQSPLAPMCTDKYAVRDYVAGKGLADILIPLVGGPWSSVDAVDFDGLPDSFAIKATHGCKMNYIVADKAHMDVEACRKEMQRWLDTTYGTYSMEPHYLHIPHRIYAEKFLKDIDDLVDYKFHCMNGVPQFVLVCSNRRVNSSKRAAVTLEIYDMNWKPVSGLTPHSEDITVGDGKMPRPASFEKMKACAAKLSENFDFVRVDLYEKDGDVFFGELTFSPACCVFPNFSLDFQNEMGAKLCITRQKD